MSFITMLGSLALIIALNLHCIASSPTNFGAADVYVPKQGAQVFDATLPQLNRIVNSHFINLPNIEVRDMPHAGEVIMSGRGAYIQRDVANQKNWDSYKGSFPSGNELEDDLLKLLEWDRAPPSPYPELLNEDMALDQTWVKAHLAIFPIKLPTGLRHGVLMLRAPMVTEKSFDALPGEVPFVTKYSKADLIDFINAHEAFGSTTQKPILDKDTPILGDSLYEKEANPVPQEAGIEAMTWATRHITNMIFKILGVDFHWFRVNRELRNFHAPDELHFVFEETPDVLEKLKSLKLRSSL